MTINRQRQALARAAFTLMEMLVVVAILVVLAGAAVPIYLNYLKGARLDRAKIDMKNLETAVDAYCAKYGDYPPSLQALTQPNQHDGSPPTLTPQSLRDPWGQEYTLDTSTAAQTGKVNIISRGPPGSNQPLSSAMLH